MWANFKGAVEKPRPQGGALLAPSPASNLRSGKKLHRTVDLGRVDGAVYKACTNLKVDRKFNLGGTVICHRALLKGAIDLYTEHTGTALTAILNMVTVTDPEKVFTIVKDACRKKFRCEWLETFDFKNTYAIAVQRQDAQRCKLRKIGGLRQIASKFRAGFTFEFRECPDGYLGLKQSYGFGQVVNMDPALMYQAFREREGGCHLRLRYRWAHRCLRFGDAGRR